MIHWVINVIVLTWIFVWFRSVLVSYWNMFSEGTVAVTTKFHHVLLQRSNILFFFGDDTGTLLMFLLNIWHQTVRASIDVNEKKKYKISGRGLKLWARQTSISSTTWLYMHTMIRITSATAVWTLLVWTLVSHSDQLNGIQFPHTHHLCPA